MSAKLIESMIPDSLRLAGHPDAELVNRAIATVIVAMDESSAMTLRGMAKAVRHALEGYYQGVYQPHIAKEDEDWSALKARAEAAPPTATVEPRATLPNGSSFWNWKSSDGRAGMVAVGDDGTYKHVIVYDAAGATLFSDKMGSGASDGATIAYGLERMPNPVLVLGYDRLSAMRPVPDKANIAINSADGTGLPANTTIDNMSTDDQRAGIE